MLWWLRGRLLVVDPDQSPRELAPLGYTTGWIMRDCCCAWVRRIDKVCLWLAISWFTQNKLIKHHLANIVGQLLDDYDYDHDLFLKHRHVLTVVG